MRWNADGWRWRIARLRSRLRRVAGRGPMAGNRVAGPDGYGTEFGRYSFFDCGAFGLFTLAEERFQPVHMGRKLDHPGLFFLKDRPKIEPSANYIWRGIGPVVRALAPGKSLFGWPARRLTVVDVGGYIGSFSIPLMLCAREYGIEVAAHVFEPGPTRDILRINLDLNRLSGRAAVHPVAVGSYDGYTTYRHGPGNAIAGDVFSPVRDNSAERIVACRRLDTICRDLRGPLLIKLDTQGLEWRLMRSAGAEIARKRAVWQIEFSGWTADRDMGGGERFSAFLQRHFTVCCDGAVIPAAQMDAFVERVNGIAGRQVDLILVPRGAAFADRVIAALRGGGDPS